MIHAKHFRWMGSTAIFAVSVLGGSSAQAAGDATAAGGATLAGKVMFEGTPPAPARIKMDADPVCGQQHSQPVHAQDAVVNNGALQYVFVYVKSGLEGKTFPAPTQPVVFDQRGCIYDPHVVGVRVGQALQILNSDATLHNVNCKPKSSTPFNLAMPTKGMKISKTFSKPELAVPVKCNVHPWMQAYIHVMDHPFFAVSGADGSFTIAGLPAGKYTLEAWHEKLGVSTQEITVADGESKAVSFTFRGQ
ncbi:MAG: hypothetical protein HY594_05605 [Candidatus Omnitrophica bacterium]|nr:hypothetical protein [Candidatus Omnitrophota bacterium]